MNRGDLTQAVAPLTVIIHFVSIVLHCCVCEALLFVFVVFGAQEKLMQLPHISRRVYHIAHKRDTTRIRIRRPPAS